MEFNGTISVVLPFLEYKRFSGLRSLCAMFMSWRYLTAMQMSFINSAASEITENYIELMKCDRLFNFETKNLMFLLKVHTKILFFLRDLSTSKNCVFKDERKYI